MHQARSVHLSGIAATIVAGLTAGCTRDPASPSPVAIVPSSLPARSVAAASDRRTYTLTSDSGSFTLNVAASTILLPSGEYVVLAPDALAWYKARFAEMITADSTAAALASARPPATRPVCNPRLTSCGPARPQSVPGGDDGGDFGSAASGSAPVTSTVSAEINTGQDMSCRDISKAMLDLMPAYRSSASYYQASLAVLTGVLIAQAGRLKRDPKTGEITPPDVAVTLLDIVGERGAIVAVAQYELASVNYAYWKYQLGVLGTMFALKDCLNADWGVAPTLPPTPTTGNGGGGGGGSGGGAGGGGMCYYRVTTIDGREVNRTLWYCVPR